MQSVSDIQIAQMDLHYKNVTKVGLMTRKVIIADYLEVN